MNRRSTLRFHSRIKEEIMQYLMGHPELKDCTASKMAKEGSIREGGIDKNWLKKHLKELEERGLIYSKSVQDPVRNIEFTYYTLRPTCKEAGEVGVPKFVANNTDLYIELLMEFYANLGVRYDPLTSDFCALCEDFRKVLNRELTCGWFLDIFLNWKGNSMTELTKRPQGHSLTFAEIEELKTKADEWEKMEMEKSTPFFLEDLTTTLIRYVTNCSYWSRCEECKEYKNCLKDGQEWVSAFLAEYVDNLPESDLTKFWKSIISGVPEIKTSLLNNYFFQRFDLKKKHNSTMFLEIFADRRLFPYFYAKVIPLSLVLLVEEIVMPCMKELGSIYRKYNKQIK